MGIRSFVHVFLPKAPLMSGHENRMPCPPHGTRKQCPLSAGNAAGPVTSAAVFSCENKSGARQRARSCRGASGEIGPSRPGEFEPEVNTWLDWARVWVGRHRQRRLTWHSPAPSRRLVRVRPAAGSGDGCLFLEWRCRGTQLDVPRFAGWPRGYGVAARWRCSV